MKTALRTGPHAGFPPSRKRGQRGAAARCVLGSVLAAGLLAGCRHGGAPLGGDTASRPAVYFDDIAGPAGVRFRHHSGAVGKKWLPETMGSGCAMVDVDNDGRLDLVLVDSTSWPGSRGPVGQARLFRNRGGGRFEDATRAYRMPAGIYGMGVAAGDYDNDGYTDLLLTALGDSRLLHNEHGRTFADVTRGSGIATPGWPTSAAWVDYDRDGRLDLFVCHYVKWSPATDLFFTLDGATKTYARPDNYPGEPCQMFRNVGGHFVDVSAQVGVARARAKALGVALCDFDHDGWADLAVSNDTVPNLLFHNQGNGTFKEVAEQAGIAVAEAGMAKAGMGIDAADFENDGAQGILITNFTGEQLSLYRQDASGLFMDVAARAGLGSQTQHYLGFGAFFFDADLDGWQDILVANGHIQEDVSVRNAGVSYAEPALLFRGRRGKFQDITSDTGALRTPRVARGAAYGDIDGDGDLDVLMATNAGPAALLRLAGRPAAHWLRLRLEGRRGNRSAIGATVRVRSAGAVQSRMVRSGSSYLSQSDLRLTFGLGSRTSVDDVEVRWPNGNVESFGKAEGDRELCLVEGRSGGLEIAR